jgi:ABC-type uncharacterized transport system auxiliary subunit
MLRSRFVLSIVGIFFLIGCATQKHPEIKTQYYAVSYDIISKTALLQPLPFVLRVERFQAAPYYDSNDMVYQEDQFKRKSYYYHKWAANPRDMVSFLIARDLRRSSICAGASYLDTRADTTHVIEGIVIDFSEKDGERDWQASLSIGISLISEKKPDRSTQVLFQKQYSCLEPCMEKSPHGLARAMSRAMEKISKKIIMDVYQTLSRQKPILGGDHS